MQPLVLGGRIEMTGTGGRHQLDFIAHFRPFLNFDALGTEVGDDHVDTTLFNGAQAASRDPQTHEALFGFEPKSVRVQIGQEAAALAIIRMRNRVPRFRALARDLANSRHGVNLWT
jgi:hypothetical protein